MQIHILNLIYKKDHSFIFNVKRLSIIVIIFVSFIISFGRIYCLYDDAFVIYKKYKNLKTEEIHRAFNHTEFSERLKKRIGIIENVLVVKHDPANLFLSYYLYPRKVFKFKNAYFRESTHTFEEVPKKWILKHNIQWVVFEYDDSKVKRLKR
jgi:predicted type IV restriction endonuclease